MVGYGGMGVIPIPLGQFRPLLTLDVTVTFGSVGITPRRSELPRLWQPQWEHTDLFNQPISGSDDNRSCFTQFSLYTIQYTLYFIMRGCFYRGTVGNIVGFSMAMSSISNFISPWKIPIEHPKANMMLVATFTMIHVETKDCHVIMLLF